MSVFARVLVERVRVTQTAARLARALGEEHLARAYEDELTDLLRLAEDEGIPIPAFSAWT